MAGHSIAGSESCWVNAYNGRLRSSSEIRPAVRRALALRERALGPDHPDVGTTLLNLASLYDDQGNHSEALALYQRALILHERILGPNHPNVAVNLHNIALLYDEQGNQADALPLHQRAVSIAERGLGPDHPYTKTFRQGLKICQDALNRRP